MKNVFVTYAWSADKEKNEQVYSFVRMLRENGYDATCDVKEMQERNAASFTQIISDGFQNYDKVIIILSEEYKKKASNPTTGVCKEYGIIDSERNRPENRWKYIFVSFEGCSDETRQKIVPVLFQEIAILDLREDEKNGFRELFSRLNEEPMIDFGKVDSTKPHIEAKEPEAFNIVKWNGKVEISPGLKNFLYEWIIDNTLSFDIKICDMDLENEKCALNCMREKIRNGAGLTVEEDTQYPFLVSQVKRKEEENRKKEEAIKLFFRRDDIRNYMTYITVENILRLIRAVADPGTEEKGSGNVVEAEAFHRIKDKNSPHFFRVFLDEKELREITLLLLQTRGASMWDVGVENVAFRIMPRFLRFLVDYSEEELEELGKLENYSMGIA